MTQWLTPPKGQICSRLVLGGATFEVFSLVQSLSASNNDRQMVKKACFIL